MKKSLFVMLALLPMFVTTVFAEEVDTVKVINKPNKVVFTESQKGLKVDVIGAEKDSAYRYTFTHENTPSGKTISSQQETRSNDVSINYPFQKNDTSKCTAGESTCEVFTSGLYAGFGWNHVDKEYPDFRHNIGHEYEIGILNMLGIGVKPWKGGRFSLGFGFEWRRYHMHYHKDIDKAPDGLLYVTDFAEGSKDCSTNIHIFALQFPLLYRQMVSKKFAVWCGGVMNVNTGAHVTSKHKLDDRDYVIKIRDLHQRKVSFDIIGGFGMEDGLGIYLRYRPQSLFKKGYRPEMDTFSVGLTITI